jgi:hypothetical protein
MKRALLAPFVLAATVVATSDAHAEVPAWSALPEGHATAPPRTKAPASIAPHERVPGFVVVQPTLHPAIPKRSRHLLVVANAKLAEQVKANGGASGEISPVCFSQQRGFGPVEESEDPGERSFDWTEGFQNQAFVFPRSEHDSGGVTPVHAEQLIEDERGARIESVDAWVDPATRGVRKITSATLPLRLVRTAIGGLKIYAARDQRKDVRLVQFVIVQPRRPEVPQTMTIMAMHHDGGSSNATSCSHLRVAVPIRGGEGDGATVTTTLELPPREAKTGEREEREIRLREARVQLSVSQTARDHEPVVSVSFGWAGRETTQRAVDTMSE